MEAAIVKARLDPLGIAAGIKKVAVLETTTYEYDFIKDKALVVYGFVLIHFYFASHF